MTARDLQKPTSTRMRRGDFSASIRIEPAGGDVLDIAEEFTGKPASDFPPILKHQLLGSLHRRVMLWDQRPVALGGVYDHGDWREGWLMLRPDWTVTKIMGLPLVRAIRREVRLAAAHLPLTVFCRTEAGARMARCCGFSYSHTMRINEILVEVHHVVDVKNHAVDVRPAGFAQGGGNAGSGGRPDRGAGRAPAGGC